MALAKQAPLLVLDEPVASLDPVARLEFMGGLMAAVADRALTVIISSHVVTELERVCDWVIVLAGGTVRAAGPVDELIAAHRAPRGLGPQRQPDTDVRLGHIPACQPLLGLPAHRGRDLPDASGGRTRDRGLAAAPPRRLTASRGRIPPAEAPLTLAAARRRPGACRVHRAYRPWPHPPDHLSLLTARRTRCGEASTRAVSESPGCPRIAQEGETGR